MRTMSGDGFGEVVAGKLNQFNAGRFHYDHLNVERSRKLSGSLTRGWSYLRRYITVLDLVQHRLYLRPSKYYDASELLDKSGLEFFIREGEMIVTNFASLVSTFWSHPKRSCWRNCLFGQTVEIDGIIGMQSFANLVLELDLPQNQVRVSDHVPKDVIASSPSFPLSIAGKRFVVTASIPTIGFVDFAINSAQPPMAQN